MTGVTRRPRRGSRSLRPASVRPIIAAVLREHPNVSPIAVQDGAQGSNELTEVRCISERCLIIKRARYAWDRERFRAARLASDLLTRRTGIIAPRPLAVPDEIDGTAVEAYWRIELPTLRELWSDLPPRGREAAARSWGALLCRVHKIRLARHGFLRTHRTEDASLGAFLAEDLGSRLAPAIAAWWPDANDIVGSLRRKVPELDARVGAHSPVLLHNDPHYGNVLCSVQGARVRCVGVLDLEAAMAGPAESDVAHVEVLHGNLFGLPLDEEWRVWFRAGYGKPIDDFAVAFYRVYHLLNLGFHAAFTGDHDHAAQVAGEATASLTALPRGDHGQEEHRTSDMNSPSL